MRGSLRWTLLSCGSVPWAGARTRREIQMCGAHIQKNHTQGLQQACAFAARTATELPKNPACQALQCKGPCFLPHHMLCTAALTSTIPPIPCLDRPEKPDRDTEHVCLYSKLLSISSALIFFFFAIKIFQKEKTIPPPSLSLPAMFPRCQLISDAQLVHSHL